MVDDILLDSDGRIEHYIDPIFQDEHEEQLQEVQDQEDQEVHDQNQEDQEDQLQEVKDQEDQEDLNDQYLDLLKSIDNKLGDLEDDNIRDTKTFQEPVVLFGDGSVSLSDNQAITLSGNIIDKPINSYNTVESLLLFIVISIVIGCLAFIIKRSVFRWN